MNQEKGSCAKYFRKFPDKTASSENQMNTVLFRSGKTAWPIGSLLANVDTESEFVPRLLLMDWKTNLSMQVHITADEDC